MDKIKILHLEDTQTDAEQIHRVLKNAKLNFEPLVVDTREEYINALNEFMPDVVISDHSLPAFNSVEALDILIETNNKVPFILVTGAVSEEFAAEVMKKGADDYILKDRPHRLPAAVLNAVQKHRLNIKLQEMQEGHEYLASIISSSNDAIISKNLDGTILSWNDAAEKLFGYTSEEAIGKSVLMLIPTERAHEEVEIIAQMKKKLPIRHYETERLKKDGTRLQVSLSISPVTGPKGTIIGISKIARDITERKQAEAKLNASEKQFRAMIEKSADMITLAQPDGTFSYGSPSITKALGYELEEFFQLSAFDLIHAEDIPVLSQKVQDVLQTPGKSFYNQHRLKHKNGHWLWTEGIMTNMLQEPSVQALISNFRDITERRSAEQTMKENYAALTAASKMQASILDALPANIALLDKNGVIVEVNESWVRFGNENALCSPQHNIGDNYIEISDKATGEDEEAGKQIAEGIRTVINGTTKLFELEYPCHSPTEQRWFKAEVAPLQKQHGKGAVVMHINITERKKAEEELRQSHVLIQKLTDQVPLAVYQFEISPDGKMSFPFMGKGIERILPGMTAEVVKADSSIPFAQIHPDDLPAFLVSIEQSRQNLTLWQEEYRSMEPDGQYKWMQASSRPENKEDGTVVWYGYIQDINERKVAQAAINELNETLEVKVQQRTAELTEANTALEAFSYSVSHDLRSPVRAMIGFSSIIRKEYEEALSPEMKELFSHIESSGKRMSAIIDDLLTLAKFGKEKLKSAPVDMNKLFSNAIDSCMFSSQHKATFDLQPLPSVMADASMLEQVIVNLVSNALKYSSKAEKPHIQIGTTETESGQTFFIKDNGAGFDMKQYERLFGAFQRLHGSSEFEGTGVGLTLVKRIIEKHNGRVWAEGKVNEGATFYFSLPK